MLGSANPAPDVRLADVVASLSLATDLAGGRHVDERVTHDLPAGKSGDQWVQ
jgi:hypothetical protein